MHDGYGTNTTPAIEAAGTWTQAGNSLPLTLKKTDKATELRRPQTPKAPFPYKMVEVSYQNKTGGVTLAGTLTEPEGQRPFPALILISGSGAQDRDETLFEHKSFLVLADTLTRHGIAVLRVDDRGVGGSSGSTASSTSDDFAGDVLAGIAFLKMRSEIDPSARKTVKSRPGRTCPRSSRRSRPPVTTGSRSSNSRASTTCSRSARPAPRPNTPRSNRPPTPARWP